MSIPITKNEQCARFPKTAIHGMSMIAIRRHDEMSLYLHSLFMGTMVPARSGTGYMLQLPWFSLEMGFDAPAQD